MKTTLPQKTESFTTQFFQLLTERRFTEAERALEQIRQGVKATEHYRGYINALEGMLIALKSNDDRYVFISQIEPSKVDELRTEFSQESKNPLHADFDRGFFVAWADYVSHLGALRTKLVDQPPKSSSNASKEQA